MDAKGAGMVFLLVPVLAFWAGIGSRLAFVPPGSASLGRWHWLMACATLAISRLWCFSLLCLVSLGAGLCLQACHVLGEVRAVLSGLLCVAFPVVWLGLGPPPWPSGSAC